MSLINTFPEIDNFFKQDKFSQTDLETLITNLRIKYTDKNTLSSALSMIKLELIKFEIINNKIEQKIKEKQNLQKISKKIPRDIENLSKLLKVSKHFLICILKQKSINIESNEILSEEDIIKIKSYIESRLSALKRQNKIEKEIFSVSYKIAKRTFSSGKKRTIGVYDKIGLIGLGKVIYIRSK